LFKEFVQDTSTTTFFIMAAIPIAIAGVGVFVARRTLWQMKALRSATVISPDQARLGYFRLEGNAALSSSKIIKAPLTRTPCIWYRIKVEEWRRSSSDQKHDWRTIRDEESEANFIVAGKGADLLVDPWKADITCTDKSLWYGANKEPDERNPPRFPPWQNPKGDGLQIEISGGPNSKFRFSEERIYEGDPIFVLGEIVDDDGIIMRKPGDSSLPFLISTTEPSRVLKLQKGGIFGSLMISGFGVLLLAVLLWLKLT
jgi:hypothetical protein